MEIIDWPFNSLFKKKKQKESIGKTNIKMQNNSTPERITSRQ